MKEFIKSLFLNKNFIDFKYGEYNTLYVKDDKYDSYYLYFFLTKIGEIRSLHEKYDDIYIVL